MTIQLDQLVVVERCSALVGITGHVGRVVILDPDDPRSPYAVEHPNGDAWKSRRLDSRWVRSSTCGLCLWVHAVRPATPEELAKLQLSSQLGGL